MNDTEFWNHINSVNAVQVLLAVIEYYNAKNDKIERAYFSTRPFKTSPTDSLPNVAFDDVLDFDTKILTTSISIPNPTDNKLSIRATAAIEEFTIINPQGFYDYLLDCVFDGYSVDIYLGDTTFQFSEFRQLKRLIASNLSSKGEFLLGLQFSALDGMFNCEAQRYVITNGVSKGNPQPLAYGSVYRASPVLLGINGARKRYKLNQFAIKEIHNVKDNGVSLDASVIVKFLNVGEFELATEPSGTITVDFDGTVDDDGTFIDTVGKVVKHLLKIKSTDVTLNPDSLAQFEAEHPDKIGIYIPSRINLNELLDKVLDTCLGFKYFDTANTMYIKSLTLATVANPFTIIKDYLVNESLSMKDTFIMPLAAAKIGFKVNYTPADNSALMLLETERQQIKLPYSTYDTGIIYDEVFVNTITKINATECTLTFTPASLATMSLLTDVKIGDYVAIYLGVANQNQGYSVITAITASAVTIAKPGGVSEASISATVSVLKKSNLYKIYKNPISAEVRDTFFVNKESARQQGLLLLNIFSKIRRIYTMKIVNVNVAFKPLQHVRLVFDRYGFNNGVDGWILSYSDAAYTSESTIDVLI